MSTGRIVNRADLAVVMGVTVVTIDNWVRAGCPFVERGSPGNPWQFNTADIRKWREQSIAEAAAAKDAPRDIDEAKQRKMAAEAQLAEIEVKQAEGELVEVEHVLAVWLRILAEIRIGVMGVAPKAAPKITAKMNTAECEAVISGETDKVLQKLTDAEVVKYTESKPDDSSD